MEKLHQFSSRWRRFGVTQKKGFVKNPFFYFGTIALTLFSVLCFANSTFSVSRDSNAAFFNPFFSTGVAQASSDAFFNQNSALAMETPDLKVIQDNSISAISTPRVLSPQTLGSLMGGPSTQNRTDVTNYTVQAGDTMQSVADTFGISLNTLMWANHLSKNASLSAGQTLVILPVSGVIHVVKSGDTIIDIAKTYKANTNDIISFNGLANENDIFIGDILIIPNGTMPEKKLASNGEAPLPNSFFIFPAEGVITQGLHYYNAVDLANQCGTPIYAAAAGTVQRAVSAGGWDFGMGNYITILHVNGVVTYYGHLMALFVKPGDKVNVGDRIGLMGRTGDATGCHVHFQVMGGANPLARYALGTRIGYK